MRIWKWMLDIQDRQTMMMPRGAKLLGIQIQNATPCLWALCEPLAPKEPRCIAIYGTGHLIVENPGEYIGTFQVSGGAFVFHAFEVKN